jgi:hypothetical protein
MANWLTTLSRLNRTTIFLGTLAVGLLGMFLPGLWGALLLYGVVAALAGLLSVTWAITPVAIRLARLAGLAVIATIKLLG